MKNIPHKIPQHFFTFCGLILLLLSNLCAARPVIIDTDAAIDDAIAMLYLLNNKSVEVKAITIAATGEAHCEPALHNIAGLLNLTQKTDVPVACGQDQPLPAGGHRFPNWIRVSADTMYGMASSLHASKSVSSGHAVSLLANTLMKSEQPVDIVAIAPLTNLADVLTNFPATLSKIHMIYIMGGAVNIAGNISIVAHTLKNHVAEWNFYADPNAADIVFRSGAPITLVPLNATNQVPIDKAFYAELARHAKKTGTAKFIAALFTSHQHDFLTLGWYFWDPLAAVIATNESIASIKEMKLRVVTAPEEMAGATIVDNQHGNTIRVCTSANNHQFTQLALQTMLDGISA